MSGLADLHLGNTQVGLHFASRIRHWMWKRFGPGGQTPVTVHGHRMVLPDPPPVDMLTDRWEKETTRALEWLVREGMVFVDAGAHIGYYTLLAARHVGPSGKVYAFEPAAENLDLLRKNVELNGYRNVVVVPKALADRPGIMDFYLCPLETTCNSFYYRSEEYSRQPVKVEVTTLDDFLEAEGWPRVDVVKIDVEGAERMVLAGMRRLLARKGALRLIVEVNPGTLKAAGVDPQGLLQELRGLSFRLSVLDKAGETLMEHLRAGLLSGRDAGERVNLLCERNG